MTGSFHPLQRLCGTETSIKPFSSTDLKQSCPGLHKIPLLLPGAKQPVHFRALHTSRLKLSFPQHPPPLAGLDITYGSSRCAAFMDGYKLLQGN